MSRTAKEVIDQALSENRFSQWLLYGLTTIFVTTGLAIVAWTVYRGDPIPIPMALSTFTTGSFLAAIRIAHQMWRQSIAIRLLEAALSGATTSEEAEKMLIKLFASVMGDDDR